jgi:hypothetical protein
VPLRRRRSERSENQTRLCLVGKQSIMLVKEAEGRRWRWLEPGAYGAAHLSFSFSWLCRCRSWLFLYRVYLLWRTRGKGCLDDKMAKMKSDAAANVAHGGNRVIQNFNLVRTGD